VRSHLGTIFECGFCSSYDEQRHHDEENEFMHSRNQNHIDITALLAILGVALAAYLVGDTLARNNIVPECRSAIGTNIAEFEALLLQVDQSEFQRTTRSSSILRTGND
jgi:hypothetical protein